MHSLSPPAGSDTAIDLTMSFDRIYWRHELKVTEQQLMDAIQAVGSDQCKVRRYIASRRREWQGATI